ncbi:hypothetical protein JD844_011526 [Phrynosoma platyrhinos]|uniref:Ras-related protein Rab-37 n=1 Tax=Phrynosoma platyrhinos TaxID=52577 RepID=A0ABQ7TIG9_PHRPL|nr:hypothetical protein JD844_011526 [Phrynosoma platyrhinos]
MNGKAGRGKREGEGAAPQTQNGDPPVRERASSSLSRSGASHDLSGKQLQQLLFKPHQEEAAQSGIWEEVDLSLRKKAAKVMLLGDSGVGKTCFLIQFKDGAFLSGTFIATVGIDFRNKVVTVDGVKVKLQVGLMSTGSLLLLYDITSRMSFDNIRAWLTEIHEYAQKDVVIMLLGNKADVSSERVVRTEDGESLAREYGVPFMETSAKTGMNVELAFLAIAKELKQRAILQPEEPRFQIHDYIESQKKRSSCCSFL